jgi:hypothetical protein
MGNYHINPDKWPLKGKQITIHSTDGVTVGGKYYPPGEFQRDPQENNSMRSANQNNCNNNGHNNNSNNTNCNNNNRKLNRDPDLGEYSDSDSYYLDSEINEYGVDYSKFVVDPGLN